ncbi:MAG: polysaccharide deacetylase family protein [Candidatus Omnitrophota bacterium]|nr:polysaccharide deacetylase family protein [Candidatus Omnitrophota bacterium]
MRRKLIVILAAAVVLSIIIWFRPFYVVPILNYHSVSPTKYIDTPVLNPEVFAKQMEFIYRRGYKVISLDDYIEQRQAGKRLINTVVITFDDGYEDNFTYAFPILKKYHFPATIFLVVNDLGKPRFLTLSQIKEMGKENIGFGSHTINHHYLPAVIEDGVELKQQIFESKKILEQKIGRPIDYFCYPLGGHNEYIKKMVKDAGYKAAFTTNKGKGKLNQDIYAIKRVKATQRTSPGLVLWFKLSGYYLLFRANIDPY